MEKKFGQFIENHYKNIRIIRIIRIIEYRHYSVVTSLPGQGKAKIPTM